MTLTETGQSRIRGYLFILERSLRSFLPPAVASDAVREVESHILDRLEQLPPSPDERAVVERVLAELGPPLRVAQAYSMEMTVDEAVTTGRLVAIGRALWHVAAATIGGFFAAIGLFCGYSLGLGFVAIAVLKPIFPANVGFGFRNGWLVNFGAQFDLPPGMEIRGGYWVIPLSLFVGSLVLIATHALARRLLARRQRRLAERREGRLAAAER